MVRTRNRINLRTGKESIYSEPFVYQELSEEEKIYRHKIATITRTLRHCVSSVLQKSHSDDEVVTLSSKILDDLLCETLNDLVLVKNIIIPVYRYIQNKSDDSTDYDKFYCRVLNKIRTINNIQNKRKKK